jgi:membrane-associated phospholipid phosphatase
MTIRTSPASLPASCTREGKRQEARRAAAADLGLHTVAIRIVAIQAVLAVMTVVLCRSVGIGVGGDPAGWFIQLGPPVMLLVLWCAHYVQPGLKSSDWWIAEAALGLALVGVGTIILASAQYAAAALNRPLVDPWLAAADARLGIHVPSLVAWTQARPWAAGILQFAYVTLVPQMILLIAAIWWRRDRQALWQYVVTYHICAFVTVLSSAFWPSEAPFTYYGFTVLLDFTRFMDHFHGLREGTMTVVPFGNIEGLISIPSFHVIGGLLLTSAAQKTRLFVPIAILNTLLIISTVMIGVHYAVDVLAGITLWAASVLIYRRLVVHLVPAFGSSKGIAPETRPEPHMADQPYQGAAAAHYAAMTDISTAENSVGVR